MVVTAYVGWEKEDGSYSCSHLFGKGFLGPEAVTLPQKELHILSVGADITELLSVVLKDWVEEVLVAGDSEIALCWVLYETVKLNQYNRVRVINIKSKLALDNLFHIQRSENCRVLKPEFQESLLTMCSQDQIIFVGKSGSNYLKVMQLKKVLSNQPLISN